MFDMNEIPTKELPFILEQLAHAIVDDFLYVSSDADVCVHCGEDSSDCDYEDHATVKHGFACPVSSALLILKKCE